MDLQQRIVHDGRVLARLGITVDESSEDGVGLRLTVARDMVNAGGVCHGGLLFALADTACAYALAEAGVSPVTVDANITYLRAAKLDATVIATAEVTRAGRRMGHCDVSLSLADGSLLARYRGTCANLTDRAV